MLMQLRKENPFQTKFIESDVVFLEEAVDLLLFLFERAEGVADVYLLLCTTGLS